MYEQILQKKKHFIVIGEVVIGTDSLSEVAVQDWFIALMKSNGVSSSVNTSSDNVLSDLDRREQMILAREAALNKDASRRDAIRREHQRVQDLQQHEDERLERESFERDAEERRQADRQQEHDAADAAHRARLAQQQSAPLPPEQLRQSQQQVPPGPIRGPQNMEFPFMDVTPDKMSPVIWNKLNPQQQNAWQNKHDV